MKSLKSKMNVLDAPLVADIRGAVEESKPLSGQLRTGLSTPLADACYDQLNISLTNKVYDDMKYNGV